MKYKNIQVISFFRMGSFPAMLLFSAGFKYSKLIKHLKNIKAKEWVVGISEDKKLIENGKYFGLYRSIENNKTGEKKDLYYLIITDCFNYSDYEYCKLSHEVLHVVQFAMQKGLDIEREYEFFAYTHTFVMRKCLKLLNNKFLKR